MSEVTVDHEARRAKGRSRVTNGKALWTGVDARSVWARRMRDVLSEIISDLGGEDAGLSEGQRQLARRAASLSVSCEKIEAQLAGASDPEAERFKRDAGGFSPNQILTECSRLLHGLARLKGDSLKEMVQLPDDKLAVVTDLLCRAGDLASKAINAGSELGADLELLGVLSDRCGRTFQRLGLRRVPRELNANAFSPMRDRLSQQAEVVDAAANPLAALEALAQSDEALANDEASDD